MHAQTKMKESTEESFDLIIILKHGAFLNSCLESSANHSLIL